MSRVVIESGALALTPDSRVDADEIRTRHRRAIETAIAAGRPVPAAVLNDYPDLMKKVVVRHG